MRKIAAIVFLTIILCLCSSCTQKTPSPEVVNDFIEKYDRAELNDINVGKFLEDYLAVCEFICLSENADSAFSAWSADEGGTNKIRSYSAPSVLLNMPSTLNVTLASDLSDDEKTTLGKLYPNLPVPDTGEALCQFSVEFESPDSSQNFRIAASLCEQALTMQHANKIRINHSDSNENQLQSLFISEELKDFTVEFDNLVISFTSYISSSYATIYPR